MPKKPAPLFLFILMLAACAPQTPAAPQVDVAATVAMQLAVSMLTQTASAYTPTPVPAAPTLTPTETPTPEPTKDPTIKIVTVVKREGCYTGPGETYTLTSYINVPKKVELLGIGSVDGWYVIKNPYFRSPCWIRAEYVELDPNMDLSVFPIIAP